MVTHWESSRRPLYIRTIWKDGQHHVILDKTKENFHEQPTSRRSKQCSSSPNIRRTTKSATAGSNLKVSSVRVLLSGIKSFKNSCKDGKIKEQSVERPKTWVQPVVARQFTCRNLNKEIAFESRPTLYKSNTVEKDICDPLAEMILDNALSEKVLLWLDLATHNCQTEPKDYPTLTAQACTLETKQEKQLQELIEECRNDNVVSDQVILKSSILKNTSPRQEDQGIIVYSSEESMTKDCKQDFYHLVTPTSVKNEEYSYQEQEKEEDNEKEKSCTIKRQLHIFMPHLPKKSSECDSSILSSKISGT